MQAVSTTVYDWDKALNAMKGYVRCELNKLVKNNAFPSLSGPLLKIDQALSRSQVSNMSMPTQKSVLEFIDQLVTWLKTKKTQFETTQQECLKLDLEAILQALNSRAPSYEPIKIGRFNFTLAANADGKLCLFDRNKKDGESFWITLEDKKGKPGTISALVNWATPGSGTGSSNQELVFAGFSIKSFIDSCKPKPSASTQQ